MTTAAANPLVSFDDSEFEAFAQACVTISKKGLTKTPARSGGTLSTAGGGLLASREVKGIWREAAKIAAKKAAATAPRSGRKDPYVWRSPGFPQGYAGKHGDLALMSTYKANVWRSGAGLFLQVGFRAKSDRQKLNVVVSKFAGFDVRRKPGGGATKGARNTWIQDALDAALPVVSNGMVLAVQNSTASHLNQQIKRKSTVKKTLASADSAMSVSRSWKEQSKLAAFRGEASDWAHYPASGDYARVKIGGGPSVTVPLG